MTECLFKSVVISKSGRKRLFEYLPWWGTGICCFNAVKNPGISFGLEEVHTSPNNRKG